MELKIYMQRLSNVMAENRLLKFVVAVIGLAVIANCFFTFNMAKHERTILVPAGLNSRVEVTDGQASDGYLDLMARYVLGLALDYTPATARQQFGELLTLYAPEAFPGARKTFYSLADTVETAGVSSAFFIGSIKVDRTTGGIEATGVSRQFAQDGSPLGPDKETTYELSYRISAGRFQLTGFGEKGGSK
ncbi:MAG: type IV conjugative transfer system protein TraE [Nitrospiraceae bacterium]|nr:type IV conjugative transfer system protein TraE [Nitrospiraceae bacterium]